jgi:hypothetical protein
VSGVRNQRIEALEFGIGNAELGRKGVALSNNHPARQ